jgi:hypothetical protein
MGSTSCGGLSEAVTDGVDKVAGPGKVPDFFDSDLLQRIDMERFLFDPVIPYAPSSASMAAISASHTSRPSTKARPLYHHMVRRRLVLVI